MKIKNILIDTKSKSISIDHELLRLIKSIYFMTASNNKLNLIESAEFLKFIRKLNKDVKNQESNIIKKDADGNSIIILLSKDLLLKYIEFFINNDYFSFEFLVDIFAVDCLSIRENFDKRFCVVYNLLSLSKNWRLIIKLYIDEKDIIPSIKKYYIGAEWYEREIYDMYGLSFDCKLSSRRILMSDCFSWYPMRKDFPLSGYTEVSFNEEKKSIIHSKVNLSKSHREFIHKNPWKGYPNNNECENILHGDEKASK